MEADIAANGRVDRSVSHQCDILGDVVDYVNIVRRMQSTHDPLTLRALEFRRRGAHLALGDRYGRKVQDVVTMMLESGADAAEIAAWI